ncbi:DcrB-related protein [Diaphorobacter caeni]|uniref:DcrB-related protein n=1 Tax=Diaphorobacter caeni TaxID=2784387 RepID=UPI00188E5FBD|nr:DcrB-related protein [Diaphorobacter caeni]MBF5006798.1 DUF1795 domain-containing protein [Diaphorobacter caeni]
MKYVFNEGSIEVPDGLIDQSVNLLGTKSGDGLNVVISRDLLQPQETLDAYVSRQLKSLQAQMAGFKLHARRTLNVNVERNAAEAIEIAFEYKQNGVKMHQRQAILIVPRTGQILVLAMTSALPFDAEDEQSWQFTLGSFQF